MTETVLKIGGMSCQGCVRTVEKVLGGLNGVSEVEVSLERGEARVVFDPSRQGEIGLRAAIEEAGFELA